VKSGIILRSEIMGIKMKKLIIITLLITLTGCGNSLSGMLDSLDMKVPIYVNSAAPDGGNGRGWGKAFNKIQDAINAAAEDDNEIWVAGTHTLTEKLTISKSVAIYGGFTGNEWTRGGRNLDAKTVITGGTNYIDITAGGAVLDGFEFTGFTSSLINLIGESLSLNNCKVTGNTTSAVMIDLNVNSLNVNACAFENNTLSGSSSYIFHAEENSVLNITDSTFTTNSSETNGTVINTSGAAVTITGCTFTGNTSSGNGGVFYIGTGSSVTMTDCHFTNNDAGTNGGAVYAEKHTGDTTQFVLSDCTFAGGDADNGGAIYLVLQNGTTDNVNISDCTFTANTAAANNGGAIFATSLSTTGKLNLTGCTFGTYGVDGSRNSAQYGGAVYCGDVSLDAKLCYFFENTAGSGGGAVYAQGPIIDSTLTLTLTDCIFKGNSGSIGDGGACLIKNNINVQITRCTFGNSTDRDNLNNLNRAGNFGGALAIEKSVTSIADSYFYGNSAESDGGAVRISNTLTSKTFSIVNCNFEGNSQTNTGYSGGAVLIDHSPGEITGSTFTGNTSAGNGGALVIGNSAVNVKNSKFSSNKATAPVNSLGGAIYKYSIEDATFTFVNLLFYKNEASLGGAVFFNEVTGGEDAKIINSTFYANAAFNDGGALYADSGSDFYIYNSVFYDNTGTLDIYESSATINLNYCAYTSGRIIITGGDVSPSILPGNPFVSTVPGEVNFLYPIENSLIHNKGFDDYVPTDINTDLAGNPRIVGTVDIGCYERE
jgi:predicted outer membrane repeat protein